MADSTRGRNSKKLGALEVEVKNLFRGPSTEKSILQMGSATDKGIKSWNEDEIREIA